MGLGLFTIDCKNTDIFPIGKCPMQKAFGNGCSTTFKWNSPENLTFLTSEMHSSGKVMPTGRNYHTA